MRRLIASIAAVGFSALAWVTILPVAAPLTALPALADTTSSVPACVQPTLNPHPTAPVSSTTDTLFCNQSAGTGNSGSTNTSSGSTGGSPSGSAGRSTSGTGGSHATTAGTTSGSGQVQPATGSTSGALTTAGNPNGKSGAQASNATSGGKGSASNGGFFGELTAFLGAAGGLGLLFAFLILLAIVLFIVGVVGWLRRREGTGAWGTRFARVVHRA